MSVPTLEEMTKDEILARISVLAGEIEANEQENSIMESEIAKLYSRIDQMKFTDNQGQQPQDTKVHTEYRGYLITTSCVIRIDTNQSHGRAMITPLQAELPQYSKIIRTHDDNGHNDQADAHASVTETAKAVIDSVFSGLTDKK